MKKAVFTLSMLMAGSSFVGFVALAQEATSIAGERNFTSAIPSFRDLPAWDPGYKAPRTPDGKPDLQGIWSSASLTSLERAPGYGGSKAFDQLVIPDQEVRRLVEENYYTKQFAIQAQPSDLSQGAFTDRDANRGYNAFWIDPGAEYGRVNDEWRSSWITSTNDGRIPYSAEGRAARQSRMAQVRASRNSGPETRTLGDRCLISYAGQAGPPMVNGMYNNHYQIVQTPAHVMINTEMNHDARIFSIGGEPRPDTVKPWFGDSVARWEGETLVVETRNVHPTQSRGGYVPLSPQGKVTERFTRKSDQVMLYEFTVDDPAFYTEIWKGEMPLRLSTEEIYEYACHEGNHALPGILRADAMGLDTALEKEGE
jgi:hypothetical protein